MFEILIILGVIFIIAKISSPSFWSGWSPPRRRKNTYRRGEKPYGLPWMGGSLKRRKKKYYWDD